MVLKILMNFLYSSKIEKKYQKVIIHAMNLWKLEILPMKTRDLIEDVAVHSGVTSVN